MVVGVCVRLCVCVPNQVRWQRSESFQCVCICVMVFMSLCPNTRLVGNISSLCIMYMRVCESVCMYRSICHCHRAFVTERQEQTKAHFFDGGERGRSVRGRVKDVEQVVMDFRIIADEHTHTHTHSEETRNFAKEPRVGIHNILVALQRSVTHCNALQMWTAI